MSKFNTIKLEVQDNLAILTLDVPKKLNALTAVMLGEIRTAALEISLGTIKANALLITGSGRAFSSGADLSAGTTIDLGTDLMQNYHPCMLELANLDIPVITAVNGVAAGAGMSLSLNADFVLAAKSAYFLQAFVNIGLVPDAGSSYFLPRLIGEARAREVTMLGERLPAEKAEDWGMIYKCVDDDKLMDEALKLAKRLASGPSVALSGIRKLIAQSGGNSFTEQLQAEAMTQRICYLTSDCREGVTAFMEKREAKFTGS